MRTRLAILLAAFLAMASAPAQPRSHHLVDAGAISPPPLLEIRYATAENFTRSVLYPSARAFLHRDTARALQAVQRELARDGLGLKLYDGYRPLSVQQRMWDRVRDERYVSNPAVNSGRHTRGTAVDVTLIDAAGNELAMPSPFDDFTPAAHRDSPAMTPLQRRNMLRLQAVMERHGFLPYPFEWWHFDLKGWEKYPVLDVSFEELERDKDAAKPVP